MNEPQSIEQALAARLAQQLPLEASQIEALLETPPTPDMGDLALPCFALAQATAPQPGADRAGAGRAPSTLPAGVARGARGRPVPELLHGSARLRRARAPADPAPGPGLRRGPPGRGPDGRARVQQPEHRQAPGRPPPAVGRHRHGPLPRLPGARLPVRAHQLPGRLGHRLRAPDRCRRALQGRRRGRAHRHGPAGTLRALQPRGGGQRRASAGRPRRRPPPGGGRRARRRALAGIQGRQPRRVPPRLPDARHRVRPLHAGELLQGPARPGRRAPAQGRRLHREPRRADRAAGGGGPAAVHRAAQRRRQPLRHARHRRRRAALGQLPLRPVALRGRGEQTLYFQQLKAVLRRMGHEWADRMEHVHVRH